MANDDLPDEESQLLNTHVADCPECREKLAVMHAVQDDICGDRPSKTSNQYSDESPEPQTDAR